jgi:hypothetical protein
MRSTGSPLGAQPGGLLHLKYNSNALPSVYRSTLGANAYRTRSNYSLEALAFGGDPYEPLEKAINVSTASLIWQGLASLRQRNILKAFFDSTL